MVVTVQHTLGPSRRENAAVRNSKAATRMSGASGLCAACATCATCAASGTSATAIHHPARSPAP
jgi:hypothetical protein